MKIIFLDSDGVITIPPKWNLNANKIKLIKKLVDETNAKIVVSSSWRHSNIEDTIKSITGYTKKCPKTKMLYWLVDNLYDVTPQISAKKFQDSGRGGEIQTWLDNHSKEVENYVIIDDDGDMLDYQLFHFVQTDYQTGFTEHEYELAYRVLMNKYVYNLIGLNFELRDRWRKKCEGNNELWKNTIKYNDLSKDFEIR